MSNLRPELRADRNGKLVTRHIRENISSQHRALSVAPSLGFSHSGDDEDDDDLDEAEEPNEWDESGFDDTDAAYWESLGFAPQEAVEWDGEGFTADQAEEWTNAGFSATSASSWRDAELSCEEADQWSSNGHSVETATEWHNESFNYQTADEWHEAGLDANTARIWINEANVETPTEDVLIYIKHEVPPYLYKRWETILDAVRDGDTVNGRPMTDRITDLFAEVGANSSDLDVAELYLSVFPYENWSTLNRHSINTNVLVSKTCQFLEYWNELNEVDEPNFEWLDEAGEWASGITVNAASREIAIAAEQSILTLIEQGKSASRYPLWINSRYGGEGRPSEVDLIERYEGYARDLGINATRGGTARNSVAKANEYKQMYLSAKGIGHEEFKKFVNEHGVTEVYSLIQSGLDTLPQLEHYYGGGSRALSNGAL